MARDVGLQVELAQIRSLSSKRHEKVRRMLQRGKVDDLTIEPFFLRLLLEAEGFEGTEAELEELSAKDRLQILTGLEQEREVRKWTRRFRNWAWTAVVYLLLPYPLVAAFFTWWLTAIKPFRMPFEMAASDAVFLIPTEYWYEAAVSFGPAFVVFLVFFGSVYVILMAARPTDL